MATITHDSLQWYGWDQDGASVHDVIGTRCDPYSNRMLRGEDYDHCCHSNLILGFVGKKGGGFAWIGSPLEAGGRQRDNLNEKERATLDLVEHSRYGEGFLPSHLPIDLGVE